MLQLLEQSKDSLVALRISGSVDRNDYDVMLPLLQERIKQHGKIRVYAEVQDVEDYSLKALWEDIKFDVKHATDFSKVALVGDKKWVDWLTVMAKPFTSAEVKYFDFSQQPQAWAWINE
ncbi:SpoIIAA family protein [Pontibacter mangrovi]|uniref:STAS/SEC14 domain-containing protein n=1 Tax=Pontibacter mangrovi TaxID=2589816 RepID=A0A501W781_9BACT|nr:STAS/SEC14 domain-containing protein [Pontibacter mangrovi]TPE45158.1 STAS/SEC14 domain-containing protein [Pontibacter mangrovi]